MQHHAVLSISERCHYVPWRFFTIMCSKTGQRIQRALRLWQHEAQLVADGVVHRRPAIRISQARDRRATRAAAFALARAREHAVGCGREA